MRPLRKLSLLGGVVEGKRARMQARKGHGKLEQGDVCVCTKWTCVSDGIDRHPLDRFKVA